MKVPGELRRVFSSASIIAGALSILPLPASPHSYPAPAEPPISFLGSFYSRLDGEEYVYEDQIDLWQQDSLILGLATDAWGGAVSCNRFEGTLDRESRSVTLGRSMTQWSNARGKLTDSVLTFVNDSEVPFPLALAPDPMESNAALAPITTRSAWVMWADSLIDASEARSPSVQKDIRDCNAGDARACVNHGNRIQYRKPREAYRYWKMACDLGWWVGCRFIGDQGRYFAILRDQCDSSRPPSLDRNMACEELGALAEKAGHIEEAMRWYEIGCNEHKFPRTCCDRLKALGASRQH